MGTQNTSKRRTKTQKTLSLLKKAAVTIAIFDLVRQRIVNNLKSPE